MSLLFTIQYLIINILLISITEDPKYICETCNRVFSRKVTLTKHQEVHDRKFSGFLDIDESDDEMIPDEQIEYMRYDKKMIKTEI